MLINANKKTKNSYIFKICLQHFKIMKNGKNWLKKISNILGILVKLEKNKAKVSQSN